MVCVFGQNAVAALSKFSRQLARQATPAADTLLARTLVADLAVALDAAALSGTGTGGQPTGILNTAGITSASGASLTYAGVLTAQAAMLNANASVNPETLGWITTPNVASLLSQRAKGSLTWPIWESGSLRDGVLAGTRAVSTTNMAAGNLLYGDFSQVVIPSWGPGIEIAINPVQGFASGDLSIRAMLSFDIALRHPTSFSVLTSVTCAPGDRQGVGGESPPR